MNRPGKIGWNITLFLVFLGTFALVFSTVTKGFTDMAISMLVMTTLTLWGHLLVYPLFYRHWRILHGLVTGSVCGIALSAWIVSIVVYFFGWNLTLICITLGVCPLVLIVTLGAKHRILASLSSIGISSSATLILLAWIAVCAFFYRPFTNLGLQVDDQFRYAWLFGHDFIIRMAHIKTLSQGIPLESLFFSGSEFPYYWLAYVYPALLYKIPLITLDLQHILKVTAFLYALITASLLVLFLDSAVDRRYLGIGLILALFCYSYTGLAHVFLRAWENLFNQPLTFLGNDLTNFSGAAHSFYRFFLVEPQATLGLGIILTIFLIYNQQQQSLYTFLMAGLLLGLLFGIEAVNGIMTAAWLGLYALFRLVTDPANRRSILLNHACLVGCSAVVYTSLFAIEMYSFEAGRSALLFRPNSFAWTAGPLYLVVAYGPPFLFALLGMACFQKLPNDKRQQLVQLIILVAVSLGFVFFVQHPSEPHFGLLKASRMLSFSLVGLATVSWPILYKGKLKPILLSALILATPTPVTDNLIASDVLHSNTYVRSADMRAARWIKANLPESAVIQAEPNYPGPNKGVFPKYSYGFIPIFAERRTAVGEWKVSVQEHGRTQEVAKRFHNVRHMYATENLGETLNIIKKYGIRYIYLGELEQSLYPKALTKFLNASPFQPVYTDGVVYIFQYNSPT